MPKNDGNCTRKTGAFCFERNWIIIINIKHREMKYKRWQTEQKIKELEEKLKGKGIKL